MTLRHRSLSQPTIKRVYLTKGKPAPFAGQLLSDAAVAKILSDRSAEIKELNLKIEYLKKQQAETRKFSDESCKAKLDAKDAKYKALEDSKKTQKSIMDGAVKRIEKGCESKWYKSPYFHNFLGCAVCGGLFAVSSQWTR